MADDSMSSSLSGPDSLKVFGEMSLDIGIDREGDCKLQKVSVIYDTNRRQKTWIHPVSLETFIFVENMVGNCVLLFKRCVASRTPETLFPPHFPCTWRRGHACRVTL